MSAHMTSLEDRLNWTRAYYDLGWSMFPVGKNKRPVTQWKNVQEKRLPLSDLIQYVNAGHGLALATGKLSGICVVDDDNQKKGLDSGFPLESLVVAKSGGGGYHYYYADFGARNKQAIRDKKDNLINIDLRGEGGYVLLPPFFGYEWISEPTAERLSLLPGRGGLPKTLLDLFENKNATGGTRPFKDLLRDTLGADSYRDPELFELSRRMWISHFQGYPGYSPAHITEFLHAVNATFNPPKPISTVEKVIEQGHTYAHRLATEKGWIAPSESVEGLSELVKRQIDSRIKERFMSSYKKIDEATGGFEYSNTYVVAGLEKSGKSSFLMKMLQMKLEEGVRIGYVNTEMPAFEFASKMAGYWLDKKLTQVTDQDVISWTEKFSEQFEYLGVESGLGLSAIKPSLEKMVATGVRALVFDNITSWGNKATGSQESWQVITKVMDDLLAVTKNSQVVSFCVMHTKQDGVVTLKNNKAIAGDLKEGNYDAIFDEGIAVVSRPTLASVYGGGGMLSQISGALLIWRPYQKLDNPDANMRSQIIVESFRYARPAGINYYFHGSRGLFSESISEVLI